MRRFHVVLAPLAPQEDALKTLGSGKPAPGDVTKGWIRAEGGDTFTQ